MDNLIRKTEVSAQQLGHSGPRLEVSACCIIQRVGCHLIPTEHMVACKKRQKLCLCDTEELRPRGRENMNSKWWLPKCFSIFTSGRFVLAESKPKQLSAFGCVLCLSLGLLWGHIKLLPLLGSPSSSSTGGGRGTTPLTDISVYPIREKFTSRQMCFQAEAMVMTKEVNGIGIFILHVGPLDSSVFFHWRRETQPVTSTYRLEK